MKAKKRQTAPKNRMRNGATAAQQRMMLGHAQAAQARRQAKRDAR